MEAQALNVLARLAEQATAVVSERLASKGIELPAQAGRVVAFRLEEFIDAIEREITEAHSRRAEGREFAGSSGAGVVMQAPAERSEVQ